MVRLALPQKLKSGVQQLSEDEETRVGTFRDAKTFVKLPLDKDDTEPPSAQKPASTTMDVNVALGETTIVQGKQFHVEKGTITFQPDDPSNPIVVATAAWTAEDGSKIYADFVGPVKTGKVNLRSDPARPKNEILAIILFGTADGANAAPPPPGRAPDGTTKAATSLGGGFAAQGLTEAMDDLTGIKATARIDTTRSGEPGAGDRDPAREAHLARVRAHPRHAAALRARHQSRDRRLALPQELVARGDARRQGKAPDGRGLDEALLASTRANAPRCAWARPAWECDIGAASPARPAVGSPRPKSRRARLLQR